MRTVKIHSAEFEDLKRLRIKWRCDWPAIFSTNANGDIWPCVRTGLTPETQRINVRGVLPLLDLVADIYRTVREEGGRIFVGEQGAVWKDTNRKLHPIVTWEFVE